MASFFFLLFHIGQYLLLAKNKILADLLCSRAESGAPCRAEHHELGNLVTYQSEKFWVWRQHTSVRLCRLWGRGRVVPRQPDDRGKRMPSFLGGKLHDHFFKSSSLFSKTIARKYWSFILEKEKYLISINRKKKFKRILNCLLGGRRKVQFTKFCLQLHLCHFVLMRTWSAHR